MNKDIYNEVLKSVQVSVSNATFSTWLAHTHLVSLNKKDKRAKVEIGCDSAFIKATVEIRYFGLIQDALTKVLEKPCDITFVVHQLSPTVSKNPSSTPLFSANQNRESNEDLAKSKILPNQTFGNYAVSSSNQMAWAAAEAVANDPAIAYNPLFIWGGVGVGKTHLANAIGHYIIKSGVEAKDVLMCSSETFTNDIVQGIRNKTTAAFRNKYRKLKALMIDDIQFIAGKESVQNEFFHTFNTLVAAGGQVILTSDKPPTEIPKLEDRLRSRFEGGLIVDVSPPDYELRCAIIQIKSKERGLDLEPTLVHLIASNIDAARKIQGFLTKLTSQVKLKNIPPSEDLIKSIIGRGVKNNETYMHINPLLVVDKVSSYYSVSKKALLGKGRTRIIARPRQMLMYLLRTEMGLPLKEVGRVVGNRDHTTVMHAVNKITALVAQDVQISEDLLGIKSSL